MSQTSRGIFGALAIALTFGAVQLASGRDLSGTLQDPAVAAPSVVNRTAKADRAAGPARSDVQTRTISLQLNGLSDTSVLVRVPAVAEATRKPSAPFLMKSGDNKRTVACEPMVSVLTEVAKQLQPGRCVT
jgi:hypothetical protein